MITKSIRHEEGINRIIAYAASGAGDRNSPVFLNERTVLL